MSRGRRCAKRVTRLKVRSEMSGGSRWAERCREAAGGLRDVTRLEVG